LRELAQLTELLSGARSAGQIRLLSEQTKILAMDSEDEDVSAAVREITSTADTQLQRLEQAVARLKGLAAIIAAALTMEDVETGTSEVHTIVSTEPESEEVTELSPLDGRPTPFVLRDSSHVVTVQMGNFWLELINSDMFINQRVAMLDASQQTSHGLLGQTWSGVIYDADASIPWIEGKVWDYAMADHELFSHRFVYNQFKGQDEDEDEDEEEEDKHALAQLFKKAGKRLRHVAGTHSHAHAESADL